MNNHRVFAMKFADVYPLYVQKAERKNRTKKEVDQIICWLTGYNQAGLQRQIKQGNDFETFFAQAPAIHPNSSLIKGIVCGVRVEEIQEPLMQKIRYLDKLIDELAKGKTMEKILRQQRMILPKKRDPRFITVRRGGTLQDSDHYLLAIWAADCAQHVLHLFEEIQPNDDRPRRAIELARAWARGEITMTQSRAAGGHAMAAARELSGAARHAAFSAGQAAVVAHVAAHELGAAAYAIQAVRASVPKKESKSAGRRECQWQHEQLPDAICDLVLDDQRLRNDICWFVFDC